MRPLSSCPVPPEPRLGARSLHPAREKIRGSAGLSSAGLAG
nr:MAG TPA: hypothetical protein [Caudoviricetes sp.]